MKKLLMAILVWSGFVSVSIAVAEDCLPCKGKINNAIIRYDGDADLVHVLVLTRKGAVLFEGRVAQYGSISLSGADNLFGNKSTLGPAITVYVNGELNADFHTSCSQPFGPGTTDGDFVVLSATSRLNGLTCPTGPIPDPPTGD